MLICLTSVTFLEGQQEESGFWTAAVQFTENPVTSSHYTLTDADGSCSSLAARDRHLPHLLFSQTHCPACTSLFHIIFIIFLAWSSSVRANKKNPTCPSAVIWKCYGCIFFVFHFIIIHFMSLLYSHMSSSLSLSHSFSPICIHLVPCSCSEPFCHSDWLWWSVIWPSDMRWCLQTGVEDSGIVSADRSLFC